MPCFLHVYHIVVNHCLEPFSVIICYISVANMPYSMYLLYRLFFGCRKHRLLYLDQVQWECWNHDSTLVIFPIVYWKWGKSDVEERGVEWIQHCLMVCDRDTWQRAIGQAWCVCNTRRQRECDAGEAEREDSLGIMDDTWPILIGCLNFYHLNNFNSIISLEIIIIIFLPKFMIFFSL